MEKGNRNGSSGGSDAPTDVSLGSLFFLFAKIGAFTLGGGYAMIPIIDNEIVRKRRWMKEEEFMDVLAIAQSAPGILAVNISIFVGYKVRRNIGSVVATLGACLPSFVFILLIAMFFVNFRDNIYVEKIFKGIRPVVVALIAVPVVDMVKRSKLNIYRALLSVVTAVAVVFLKVSPVYIIMVVAVIFLSGRYYEQKRRKGGIPEARDMKRGGDEENYTGRSDNEKGGKE